MASSSSQALNSKASRQEGSGYSSGTIWNPIQMKTQITTTAFQTNTSSPPRASLPPSSSRALRSTPSRQASSLPPVLPPNVQSKRSLRSAYSDYATVYPIVKLPLLSPESDSNPFETNPFKRDPFETNSIEPNSNPIESRSSLIGTNRDVVVNTLKIYLIANLAPLPDESNSNPIETNKDVSNAPEIYPTAKLPSLPTQSGSNSVESNSNPIKTNKDVVHPPGVYTVLEDFTHPEKGPSFLAVRKGQSVRLMHLFVISGLVTSSFPI